jgi:hypothetical protein
MEFQKKEKEKTRLAVYLIPGTYDGFAHRDYVIQPTTHFVCLTGGFVPAFLNTADHVGHVILIAVDVGQYGYFSDYFVFDICHDRYP